MRQMQSHLSGSTQKLQSCFRYIASGNPFEQCFSTVTRVVEQVLPGARACIVFADEDRRRYAHAYSSSHSSGFIESLLEIDISELVMDIPRYRRYVGVELSSPDIAHDKHWSSSWRDLFLCHNIYACHANPAYIYSDIAIGAFAVLFGTPREPTVAERIIANMGSELTAVAMLQEASRAGLTLARLLAGGHNPHMRGSSHQLNGAIGWTNALHPGELQGVMQVWEKAAIDGLPHSITARLRKSTGEWGRFLIHSFPTFIDGYFLEWVSFPSEVSHSPAGTVAWH